MLKDGDVFYIEDIKIEAILVPGHTGWHDDLDFVFAHRDQLCHDIRKQKPHDPDAPWDGYDESDEIEHDCHALFFKPMVRCD